MTQLMGPSLPHSRLFELRGRRNLGSVAGGGDREEFSGYEGFQAESARLSGKGKLKRR